MNYFEFYPGDYLRDTTRLTLIEHGAYLRLLIAYYSEEKALPADVGELYVITCAVSSADKVAVKKVADRFFPIAADGLRHKARVDEEIAKAQKRIATARENGSKGGRRSNQPDIPAGNPVGYSEVTQRVTRQDTQRAAHSGEALHTPHANTSVGNTEASTQVSPGITEEVRACILLRQAGCQRVNPSDPNLQAAITEGVTPEFLRDTYLEFPDASNPFKYAISTARGRHAEGPKPLNGASHANRSTGRKLSLGEQVEQNIRDRQARERSGDGGIIEGTYIAIGS